MLRPFLDALPELAPPAGIGEGDQLTHFGRRAAERGVASIPGDLLKWGVERALHAGRFDLIEKVFDVCPATSIYRVLLPEGPFYAVVRGAGFKARTIYSQREMKGQRYGRRMRKHRNGRRARRQVSE